MDVVGAIIGAADSAFSWLKQDRVPEALGVVVTVMGVMVAIVALRRGPPPPPPRDGFASHIPSETFALLPSQARDIIALAAAGRVDDITRILNQAGGGDGFTAVAVERFFATLTLNHVPPEQLADTLQDIARAHLALQAPRPDPEAPPEAQRLTAAARAAAADADYGEADRLYAAAIAAEHHRQRQRARAVSRLEEERALTFVARLDHAAAAAHFAAAAEALIDSDDRDKILLLDRAAGEQWIIGEVTASLALYRRAAAIAAARAAAAPGDAQAQRDLSVGHTKVGDVLLRQGDPSGALAAYRAGLVIRERRAAGDSGDAEAQRDLSVSHDRVGDVLLRQGDLSRALAAYRAGLVIRERRAAGDSGDAEA
ncbi:MAG: hypothetical protein HY985_03350, partial [Magnetospirillum sp.]|nr:hypothetical protein [Magnetospirillum sp.]